MFGERTIFNVVNIADDNTALSNEDLRPVGHHIEVDIHETKY